MGPFEFQNGLFQAGLIGIALPQRRLSGISGLFDARFCGV